MARSIESGHIARVVLDEAYKHSAAVEAGERLIVGENIFAQEDGHTPTGLFEHDPGALAEQTRRLADVRARRDDKAVAAAIAALETAARDPETNIMPATVECVRAYVTIGEIFSTLRAEFGEYQEPLDIF